KASPTSTAATRRVSGTARTARRSGSAHARNRRRKKVAARVEPLATSLPVDVKRYMVCSSFSQTRRGRLRFFLYGCHVKQYSVSQDRCVLAACNETSESACDTHR